MQLDYTFERQIMLEREDSREEGRAESEREYILSMYENDFTLEQIATVAKKSMEEIRAIINNGEPALT